MSDRSQRRTTTFRHTFVRRLTDGALFAVSAPPGYSSAQATADALSGSLVFYFVPVTVRRGGGLLSRRWQYVLHDDEAWTGAKPGEFEIVRSEVAPKQAYELHLANKEACGS